MKTNYLKLIAPALAVLFCLVSYTVAAANPDAPSKKKSDIPKKMSPKALANLKIKNIEFGFNKSTIPDNAQSNLKNVAKLMTDNNASLKLGGYADNKGAYVYNWMLSKARAEAVKAYLVKNGADSARIAATEYGYTHPIASNKTSGGRQKNRRVEIHFTN
ncbi:OmpA family protein [Mucilaginibacter sp. SMC90]|uniref:OmpA family protein n=1 Tax=Mucilaginibacter sp. SMC90 TaxID=2929803 RepID=UPI001FB4FC76|nr:OmpA family protein [Mucilaginibacter sp. SMC90]UOE51771.1 OmpA family protein [Mucilaginibacter sp. SMC90]